MTITFSEHHVPVILAALEAYERFKINQPKTALEQIFPRECWDLGWDGMKELCEPLHKAFFPNYTPNGGPSIRSEEVGDARIAYEIQKAIQQYIALKKSGGWFGSGYDFDGNLLNPSGLPPPKIEGLEEMQYMKFLIPQQRQAYDFYMQDDFQGLWSHVKEFMPDLPRGDKMEIVEGIEDHAFCGSPTLYVRVHKPRKPLDGQTF